VTAAWEATARRGRQCPKYTEGGGHWHTALEVLEDKTARELNAQYPNLDINELRRHVSRAGHDHEARREEPAASRRAASSAGGSRGQSRGRQPPDTSRQGLRNPVFRQQGSRESSHGRQPRGSQPQEGHPWSPQRPGPGPCGHDPDGPMPVLILTPPHSPAPRQAPPRVDWRDPDQGGNPWEGARAEADQMRADTTARREADRAWHDRHGAYMDTRGRKATLTPAAVDPIQRDWSRSNSAGSARGSQRARREGGGGGLPRGASRGRGDLRGRGRVPPRPKAAQPTNLSVLTRDWSRRDENIQAENLDPPCTPRDAFDSDHSYSRSPNRAPGVSGFGQGSRRQPDAMQAGVSTLRGSSRQGRQPSVASAAASSRDIS